MERRPGKDGAWFLEAWDRTGGRGLATRREARPEASVQNAGMPEFGGGPTIYVGPPGFEPELITKPSIALSAGRAGYFVQRVPADGPEAAFPSAQSVAEFVRRGFVGGGSTRGGGQGGGAPVPEGEPPAAPDVPGQSVGWLSEYCLQFQIGVDSVGPAATGTAVVPSLGFKTKEPISRENDPVVWGAVELAGAMLATYPRDWTNERAGQWELGATSLAFALRELDLWRVLAQCKKGYEPGAYLKEVVSRFWAAHVRPPEPLPDHLDDRVVDIASIALSGAPYHSHEFREYGMGRWIKMSLYGHPFDREGAAPAAHERSWNRYESLFTWPLPYHVAQAMPATVPSGGAPNAGQLVSAFLASPAAFQTARPSVFFVLCFAAAFLASRVIERTGPEWRARAAHAWLARSLPRWLFSRRLEEIIRTVELTV